MNKDIRAFRDWLEGGGYTLDDVAEAIGMTRRSIESSLQRGRFSALMRGQLGLIVPALREDINTQRQVARYRLNQAVRRRRTKERESRMAAIRKAKPIYARAW